MTDSKGDYDYIEIDSLEEPILKRNGDDDDEMFENLVDDYEPEIDERREMRESLQP